LNIVHHVARFVNKREGELASSAVLTRAER
jgi:hypothetical protein